VEEDKMLKIGSLLLLAIKKPHLDFQHCYQFSNRFGKKGLNLAVNIFIKLRKNICHNNSIFKNISDPEGIERDYLTTTFSIWTSAISHAKVKVGEIPFVVYQNKVLKPELLKLVPLE
jgi:hypothetical protein